MFKKKHQIYYLILSFFLTSILSAQTIIKGTVKSNNREFLGITNVILKQDETTIDFTFSNADGSFELSTKQKGKLILQFSSLNFETKIVELEITEKTQTLVINPELNYQPTELNEVLVRVDKPISVKKDTIVINAKSFLRGNEQVVEDLLKIIPGINIDANGTIKVGNQEIEKVMVEGDDLFEKGYKILTKNMPVNPIDKIEIYQNYSNNKLLKGIENSDKVALNLTLLEEAKRVWFGNVTTGYGLISENRYEVRNNLMNLGKKNKYYFFSNLNNVGEDATGDINHLIRPYRSDEAGSIGDDQNSNSLLNLNFSTPNLSLKRTNLNNAEMISLNSIVALSEKVKLKTIGFFNSDDINFFRNSFQSYNVGNSTFNNIEDFTGKKYLFTGFGKLDLTYDISKTKTLEYTGKFNKTNERNRSKLLFNNELLNERLQSYNQLNDHKLVFTNKVKNNTVILFSSRYINEKTSQEYAVNQFFFSGLFLENANNTKQYSENKMQFAGIESHLISKVKNGDLFELKFGNQLRIDELNTQFELLQNENSFGFPVGFQNNLTYTSNDLYFSSVYRFKLNEIVIFAQADAHLLFNTMKSYDSESNQSPLFMLPKIGIDWKINATNKIQTSYTYNTTNAGVLDLYSGYIQTGFRSFSKGLEEFNQLNASNGLLNYSYGNWGDKFFATTFIIYSKYNDFYSTNSKINQNFSQSDRIIVKDRESLSFSSSIDYFFRFVKSNFKINIGGSKSNFKNIVNNSNLRGVINHNFDYGFELRSGFRGFFNYHLGSKWNFNKVETTVKNSFTDNMSFLDLSFLFSKKFNIQLQSERYYFGNIDKRYNNYYFLDLESSYTIQENKLSVFLSANNLFNTKTFRSSSITDVTISQTAYRLQPRYVLLKLEYRF